MGYAATGGASQERGLMLLKVCRLKGFIVGNIRFDCARTRSTE